MGTSTELAPVPAVPSAGVIAAAGETSSSAIAAREKAAVEARYLVALNRPRDFETGRRRLLDACKRPRFAAAARYSKPVGDGKVTGFSIRFAEEARVLWGNIDVTTLLVFDDDTRRIYRVAATDLETNATESVDVMVEKFIERKKLREGMELLGSRTNTQGQIVYRIRATEDDLTVKVNAVISKYRRNGILSLIPADVKEECESQMLATVKDADAKDPAAARKAIFDSFWEMGVTPAQISDMLGKPVEQINPAELHMLRTYYTALKEGEATWAEIVEAHTGGKTTASANGAAPAPGKGAAGLRDTLKAKAAPTPAAAPAKPQAWPCEACKGATAHADACPHNPQGG